MCSMTYVPVETKLLHLSAVASLGFGLAVCVPPFRSALVRIASSRWVVPLVGAALILTYLGPMVWEAVGASRGPVIPSASITRRVGDCPTRVDETSRMFTIFLMNALAITLLSFCENGVKGSNPVGFLRTAAGVLIFAVALTAQTLVMASAHNGLTTQAGIQSRPSGF